MKEEYRAIAISLLVVLGIQFEFALIFDLFEDGVFVPIMVIGIVVCLVFHVVRLGVESFRVNYKVVRRERDEDEY